MIIGITGKSGSGKSTLSNLIKGVTTTECVHLDIDRIGHNVLLLPEVRDELIKSYGEELVMENMADRRKLGEIVFTSGKEMAKLHALTYKNSLNTVIASMGESKSFSSLHPYLIGRNPDDAFSGIPYVKGFIFLYYLESLVNNSMDYDCFKTI